MHMYIYIYIYIYIYNVVKSYQTSRLGTPSLPPFCNIHLNDVHCSSRPVPLQPEAGRNATREAAWCSSSDQCR